MKYRIYVVIALLLGCSSTAPLTEQDKQAYANLQALVNTNHFIISSDRAMPLATNSLNQLANAGVLGVGNTASNINISGNSNYIKVENDTVSGFLPYYGERHLSANLSSNHQGIEFKSIPENYKIIWNDAKQNVEITFQIDDIYQNHEHYDVRMTLYANNSTRIYIQTPMRSSIEYSGSVKRLVEDDKMK